MTSVHSMATTMAETGRRLEQELAALQAIERSTLPPPSVALLGAHAAWTEDPDPVAEAARAHLAPDAIIIGPWAGPREAAPCGQCLALRWQRLRSRSEREALENLAEPVGTDRWPLVTRFAIDAAWQVYTEVMTSDRRPAESMFNDGWQQDADLTHAQVTRIDLATLMTLTVPLLADPLCPSCWPSESDTQASPETPESYELRSRPKRTPTTFRAHDIGEYRLPTAAFANPVVGAFGTSTGISVTSPTTAPVAGSVFMRGYAGLNDVTWSGQANAYGTSRKLAFLEGLERYAGAHRRNRQQPVVSSYTALTDRALDPRTNGSYSPETYRIDPRVAPFDTEREIPWVWGHSLREQRPILVPERTAYYGSGSFRDSFVFECSNGCASGSSIEEATLVGLLELVERDAFLLGWYGGVRLPEIDLTTCPNPDVHAMIDRAGLLGYEVHAFDNRVDLDIPVVTTLASRPDGGPGIYSFAAGASLDVDAAIEDALSEVLTYIPHLPEQVEEDWDRLSSMVQDYDRVVSLTDHARLYGMPAMAEHGRRYLEPARVAGLEELYGGQPRGSDTDDLLDDLHRVTSAVLTAAEDVIVVDQTAPEQAAVGLCNVSVIAPGLLPIDFGWRYQRALRMPRLRTAFRAAGWRADELSEAEINAVPHPFP